MRNETISVLLVEDDEDDFILVANALANASSQATYEIRWARSYEEGLLLLESGDHDVCLVDHMLGADTGIDLLRKRVEMGHTAPVVLFTGFDNRDIDEAAQQLGAAAFVSKDEITTGVLERALRYAVAQSMSRVTTADASRTARDLALQLALAQGLSATEAAHQVGVSPRTVRRRLSRPDFRAGLDQIVAELKDRMIAAAASKGASEDIESDMPGNGREA